MIDEQIIKVFEEVARDNNIPITHQIICGDVLNLIKRTKGESNKYRNKYQSVKEEVSRLYDTVHYQKEEIARQKKQLMELKSEAIKEFAERLIRTSDGDDEYGTVFIFNIQDLVKEMSEEKNEQTTL